LLLLAVKGETAVHGLDNYVPALHSMSGLLLPPQICGTRPKSKKRIRNALQYRWGISFRN